MMFAATNVAVHKALGVFQKKRKKSPSDMQCNLPEIP